MSPALRQTIEDALAASEQVAGHIGRLRERMQDLFPLDRDRLTAWDDEQRERLHAYLRLYETLTELTGRTLFRAILTIVEEDAKRLSSRQARERLATLGYLESAEEWARLIEVRNELTHDYPTTSRLQAEIGNNAWETTTTLLAIHRRVADRLRALLDGPDLVADLPLI